MSTACTSSIACCCCNHWMDAAACPKYCATQCGRVHGLCHYKKMYVKWPLSCAVYIVLCMTKADITRIRRGQRYHFIDKLKVE